MFSIFFDLAFYQSFVNMFQFGTDKTVNPKCLKTVCNGTKYYKMISNGFIAVCRKANQRATFKGLNMKVICKDPTEMCSNSTKCPSDCNNRYNSVFLFTKMMCCQLKFHYFLIQKMIYQRNELIVCIQIICFFSKILLLTAQNPIL